MTVVHPHPHPLAMQVVTPSNPEILKTFGRVRIEDWSDRILQGTWQELRGRSSEVKNYLNLANEPGLGSVMVDNEIVACHTLHDGSRVLLHNDWLPTS
jgi:hypothetical protein